MVIKEGYKQTEIGVIPNDWEVQSIQYLTENIIDYRGVTPRKLGMDWGKGSIVALSAGNVKKGYIDFDSECYLGSEELYTRWMRNGNSKKDDIAFTLEAPLGNIALIPDNKKYILSQRTILLQINKSRYYPIYVFQYLISSSFQNYISSTATGSTAQGIKRKTFETLTIAIPKTLAEQSAIATALSDADGLITGLEKLIAKKRNIKQGAMQQLLQPKEGWEVKKLGEVSDLITKGTTPTSVGREFQNKGINFIKIESLQKNGEIVKDKVAFIDKFTHNLLQRSQLKSKDILFSIAGALGRVAIVKDEILPANTNQALAIIRLKDGYLVDYIYYYLNNEKIQKYILTISVQGAQANLSLLNISELDVPFPSLEEQTRIASILTDMDAELSALEQKLEKYKKVKLGMMQELLTGKTRLV